MARRDGTVGTEICAIGNRRGDKMAQRREGESGRRERRQRWQRRDISSAATLAASGAVGIPSSRPEAHLREV